MSSTDKVVTTVDSLIAATKTEGIKAIILGAELDGVPPIALSPGQMLRGETGQTRVSFAAGSDGLKLSTDNCAAYLVSRGRRAFNGGASDSLRGFP
ncbi:MAG TPA: hypothetical protein VN325_02490 [Steroidobacteraceae bacterium]|nr:hypothetical protein [Steroidobacteraceae bacterium]